jgi:hypothetical protein
VRWNDVYTVSKKVRIKGAEQEVEVDRLERNLPSAR